MSADDRRQLQEQRSAAASASVTYIGNGVQTPKTQKQAVYGGKLTRRELQVLCGAAEGFSYPQIAAWLGLGETTVKHYSKTLMVKLGAHTMTHAVAILYSQGAVA